METLDRTPKMLAFDSKLDMSRTFEDSIEDLI